MNRSLFLGFSFFFLVSGLIACSHAVDGEGGGGGVTQTTSQALPTIGQACRCTSDLNTPPPETCCAGENLVCADPEMPGRTTCDAIGCFRKGFCVERTSSSETSTTSTSSSSSSGESSSGFPNVPPDECSPFKNPPQGTCAAGQECHLLRDHWGCI